MNAGKSTAPRCQWSAYRLVTNTKGNLCERDGRLVAELPAIESGQATLKGLGRVACRFGDAIHGTKIVVCMNVDGVDHWRFAEWAGNLFRPSLRSIKIDAPMIIDPDNLPDGFVRRPLTETTP